MPYTAYDPLTTLRGFQMDSEIRDAGVMRRFKLLQLAQLQRQEDEAQQMRDAARGAIVPQQARVTAPDITVQGADGTMPADNPRVDSYAGIAQPAGVVRRAAPVLDTPPPATLGMTPSVIIPGATSTVAGPPAFNRDKYTDLIGAANPLLGQQEKARLAAQDAAAQEKAIEVAGKRVDLGNKITTGRGQQLDNARKEVETVAQLAGPLYQAEQNGATPEQLESIYQQQRQQVNALVQSGQLPAHYAQQLPEHYMQGIGQYAMQSAMTAKERLEQAAKQQEDGTKTVQTAEGVMQYDPKTKGYTKRIGSPTKALGVTIGADAGGAGTTLTSPAVDTAARTYLKTGQLPAMGYGKQGAAMRAQVMNRAAEIDSGADVAANKADYRANSDALVAINKQLNAVEQYEKTAGKNLDLFIAQADKVTDTGSPFLNAPLRKFDEKILGDPKMSAYKTARQVAMTEIARVVSNPNLTGVLSDSARAEIAEFNPDSATLAQTLRIAKVLKQDMENRKQSAIEQKKAIQDAIRGGSTTTQTNATPPAGATHTGVGSADNKVHWLDAQGNDLGVKQ